MPDLTSDPKLRRWYLQFNRQWFNGDLPDDVTVYWDPVSAQAECWSVLAIPGTRDHEPIVDFIIRIDPRMSFSRALAKWALLHEMAHVKLYPNLNHGPKFHAEMLRLANCGAFRKLW